MLTFFSVGGYALMIAVLVEASALAVRANRGARTIRREASAITSVCGNAPEESHLARLTTGLLNRGTQRPGPEWIKAAYQRSVRDSVRGLSSWLDFYIQTAPALGLITTMAGFVLALYLSDDTKGLMTTLGVSAGTTALGAVAMVVATAGRARLDHALDELDAAAAAVFASQGDQA